MQFIIFMFSTSKPFILTFNTLDILFKMIYKT